MKLAQYNSTTIPPNYPAIDSSASPSKSGGVWTPWFGAEEESSLLRQIFNSALDSVNTMISFVW